MKLLGEHKNENGTNLTFFAGCDPFEMIEFDKASENSDDITFMVVFAKKSDIDKNWKDIPDSDYVVIYIVPEHMENYESMINVIKEHYDKVEENNFPWLAEPSGGQPMDDRTKDIISSTTIIN